MLARAAWITAGLAAVALGGLGLVVPGLPTTVFFIIAAWCFSRSSPRLERWVLGLPRVGPMVADYRAGLGMPRRAKIFAVTTMAVFVGISVWLIGSPVARVGVAALGLLGAWYVLVRVPTREDVIASSQADAARSRRSGGSDLGG
jgi:uncharacterized membrane protein YbaN (DUF454 family)